eukprot:800091-Alexandrium_andersonii.AAC.1
MTVTPDRPPGMLEPRGPSVGGSREEGARTVARRLCNCAGRALTEDLPSGSTPPRPGMPLRGARAGRVALTRRMPHPPGHWGRCRRE